MKIATKFLLKPLQKIILLRMINRAMKLEQYCEKNYAIVDHKLIRKQDIFQIHKKSRKETLILNQLFPPSEPCLVMPQCNYERYWIISAHFIDET